MLSFLKNLFTLQRKKKSFYEILGQEQGIKELVNHFYHVMESDEKARECLQTHELQNNKVPEKIKTNLFYFLSGWLGGPNLFIEKIGAPMMRKRHVHIQIREKEKEQWLYCMNQALKKKKLRTTDHQKLLNSFMALTIRIKNSD